MLCNEVKRMVYFFLDGSLGGSKEQDFNSHLSLCPECEARTRVHKRLRSFIEKRLGLIAGLAALALIGLYLAVRALAGSSMLTAC